MVQVGSGLDRMEEDSSFTVINTKGTVFQKKYPYRKRKAASTFEYNRQNHIYYDDSGSDSNSKPEEINSDSEFMEEDNLIEDQTQDQSMSSMSFTSIQKHFN